ncbi:translation initiation factor IF-2-like [Panicum virgatum]|uniref:Uncharacterized protein n=1 Tax=Panicum virgatum TaxID=38727 RepID=A0A8T0XBM3_PANVG|nr:translation initiation factor IF-2-like [Panicum virgatum]KAG2658951.1 hypothetical protein PVAP13_1KG326700 [Panicum virgatum]
MGAAETAAPCRVLRRSCCRLFLALLLCFQVLRTSQAFELRGGGYVEAEKVPLAVIVPDPSPRLSGFSPAPRAPPPAFGGGGDDMRPRLPTERSRRGSGEARRSSAAHPPAAAASAYSHHQAPAPSAAPGPTRAPAPGGPGAPAPAPDSAARGSGGGSASIKSSPAVPVPRGVMDTATILPMPAPGEKRQEVGSATSVGAGLVPPLLLGLTVMMASFGL